MFSVVSLQQKHFQKYKRTQRNGGHLGFGCYHSLNNGRTSTILFKFQLLDYVNFE